MIHHSCLASTRFNCRSREELTNEIFHDKCTAIHEDKNISFIPNFSIAMNKVLTGLECIRYKNITL